MIRLAKLSILAASVLLASFGAQDADSVVGRWWDPQGIRLELREDGTAHAQAMRPAAAGGIEVEYEVDGTWSEAVIIQFDKEMTLIRVEGRLECHETERNRPWYEREEGRLEFYETERNHARFARVESPEWPTVDEHALQGIRRRALEENEAQAAACLRSIVNAEEVIANTDADRNGERDYWTGDVWGLMYLSEDPTGQDGIRTIRWEELAFADAAPLRPDQRGNRVYAAEPPETPEPVRGYLFRMMPGNGDQDHSGMDYGVCSYPVEYGEGGVSTFIVNSDGTVYRRDNGGQPVLEYPDDVELVTDWEPVQ